MAGLGCPWVSCLLGVGTVGDEPVMLVALAGWSSRGAGFSQFAHCRVANRNRAHLESVFLGSIAGVQAVCFLGNLSGHVMNVSGREARIG